MKTIPRIRRDIPIPYYYQLIQFLEDEIHAGTWSTDMPIPSEYELCAAYGVSRTVVRQALGDLASRGLLHRVKGKGTFVSPVKLEERFVQRTDGFYRDMTSRGLAVTTAVLEQALVLPAPHVRQKLGLHEQDRVIKIDRLRSVNGSVIVFVQTYIPSFLCPTLLDTDLSSGSLYAALRDQAGLAVVTGMRVVEAVLATSPMTTFLEVKKGSPLLKIESISFLADGRPLEYYEAWHRADRSKIEIEITAPAVPGLPYMAEIP